MVHTPLRALVQAGLAGQRLPLLSPDLVARARQHRLGGWIWSQCQAGLGAPAAAEATLLAGDWAVNFAGHLRRAEVFARHWPATAPPPLVFKGADAAEALYGDPGARAAADLDVLVPGGALLRLCRHFESRGAETLVPRYERLPHEPPYNLGLLLDGLLVELHRSAQPEHRGRVDAEALLSRGQPRALGGVPALAPSRIDRVLLWVANQAKDGFAGDLASLVDLVLALRLLHHDDRPTLTHRLASARLGHAFGLAVTRLHHLGLGEAWPAPSPLTRLVAHGLPDPTHRTRERISQYQWARLLTAPPAVVLATARRWPARLAAAWSAKHRPTL